VVSFFGRAARRSKKTDGGREWGREVRLEEAAVSSEFNGGRKTAWEKKKRVRARSISEKTSLWYTWRRRGDFHRRKQSHAAADKPIRGGCGKSDEII